MRLTRSASDQSVNGLFWVNYVEYFSVGRCPLEILADTHTALLHYGTDTEAADQEVNTAVSWEIILYLADRLVILTRRVSFQGPAPLATLTLVVIQVFRNWFHN